MHLHLGLFHTGSVLGHFLKKVYFSSLFVVVLWVVEISLNPRSPASVVTVIPSKSVQPQWDLPDVPYIFATRYTDLFNILGHPQVASCPNWTSCKNVHYYSKVWGQFFLCVSKIDFFSASIHKIIQNVIVKTG